MSSLTQPSLVLSSTLLESPFSYERDTLSKLVKREILFTFDSKLKFLALVIFLDLRKFNVSKQILSFSNFTGKFYLTPFGPNIIRNK